MKRQHSSGRPGLHRGRPALSLRVETLEQRTLLSLAAASSSVSPPMPLLIQLGSASVAAVAPLAGARGVSLAATSLPGVVRARGDGNALEALAEDLAATPGIGYVEYESLLHADLTPNDPRYVDGALWGLNGAYGINAPSAWDATTGSTRVTVAAIDTGVDYNHPDLYRNIWINQREIPASRLLNLSDIDGDGLITFHDLNDASNQGSGKITDLDGDGRIDGGDILAPMQTDGGGRDTGGGGWADGLSEDGDTAHVDDLVGWNFVTHTNNPLDDNGHGTHTAGTLGAVGDNGTGVVGVNWRVQIMALKFLDSSGNGSDADAAEAIRYAADHGARVSNNSYGGGDGSSVLGDAIAYAAAAGGVFVAAAGNSGHNTDTFRNYPSAYPYDNILSVAAMTRGGNLAGFSNYGLATVDLGAPGVGITSTLPDGAYGAMSGTSMAAPHVAGAVALLLAQHPDWTYTQIIQRILGSATANAALAGKSVSGGILNLGAALASSTAAATFVAADTTTQGSWKGVYGADGYNVIANSTAYPAYATITPSGQSNAVWAASSQEPRALQKAGSAPDRIAACWYGGTSFTVDVNITDGQVHELSIYALDWDTNSRSQRIDVLDAASGAVLDSQTLSSFRNGVYLTWNVSGHLVLRFTRLAGYNAVLSGLFLGSTAPASASAQFLAKDATTQGSWKGVYGADGYNIVGNSAAYPAYAEVSPSGQSAAVWAASSQEPRALQKAGSAPDRIAACWYSGTSFTVDVNITDGQVHKLSLYALDWDSNSRSQRIDVLDAASGAVLDSQTLSSFRNGAYLSWNVSGHLVLRFTRLAGYNAVLGGLFFG